MACYRCNGKSVIYLRYLGEGLCSKCFLRLIERRIRLNMRNKDMLKQRDRVVVLDNGSAAFQATKSVTEKISRVMPKVEFRCSKSKIKGFKTFEPVSLDDECVEFMKHIISKKPMKRRLNPTCNVPQDELELYCRIKGLRFRRQKTDANLSHLFNDLKNIRPGSLFSMQRIKEKLEAV